MEIIPTTEFIKKAKLVHGDKYDYSNVKYVNRHTAVNIVCPIHGEFKQIAGNHIGGDNCPVCMGRGKSNTKRFIIAAIQKHGNRYDYSKVDYKHNNIKVKIICRIHGVFEQSPTWHLNGGGCSKCNGGIRSNREEFIEKAIKKHGNEYNYSNIEYINSKTKVKIICKKHGIFEIKPSQHLILGQGCAKCGIEKHTLTTEEFIKKASKVHCNLYDYSLVNYINTKTKVKIICKKHGIFEQQPSCHLSGRGCSKCKINSTGEVFISEWLNQNKIFFDVQKSFPDCKNILPLRYDFYLYDKNILIEYDGEPHFKEVDYLGGKIGFELRKTNDKIKTEYAIKNNINLLRISYKEKKNLNEILKNNIKI